jgi:DNA-binding NarL/FixJ family response regulator
VAARDAVTAAKSSPWRVRAAGGSPAVRALESAVWLWAALLARRTPRGWEVADLVDQGLTYDETASRLGITQSAVSQRAAAAGIAEGRRARDLVSYLTRMALEGEA